MITITYVTLHIVLLIIFFLGGWYLDQASKKDYWKVSSVLLFFYTIEEGLRWGRGIDWCHYYMEYKNRNFHDYEFLFGSWWKISSDLNIPYSILVCCCSALFCFSLLFFFKNYKGFYKFVLPLSIAYSSISAANLIRWFIAISLILIAYRLFLDKKKIIAFLVAACIPLFHGGATLMLIFILMVHLIRINIQPIYVALISLMLVVCFTSESMLLFSNVLSFIFSDSDKFGGYANNVDGWLTGEGQNATLEKKSIVKYIISMIPFYLIIQCGYSFLSKLKFNSEIALIYRISVIGVFLLSICSGLELVERFVDLFYPFISLMFAFSIVYTTCLLLKTHKIKYWFYSAMLYVFLSYKFWVFIRPLDREFKMCYVWNEYLSPVTIFDFYSR